MTKRFLLLLILLPCLLKAQLTSSFIHVDQFGYPENGTKVAVISNPQIGYNNNLNFTPGGNLEVRNAQTDEVVFSGATTIWDGGATHSQSGDQGWWFDFSSVTVPGEYYLIDPSQDERTGTFTIGNEVYAEILKAAGRMFYYNRCNFSKEAPFAGEWTDGMNFTNALQDAECRFIYDPENAALEKDLRGGWFDAGDYNKYVTFTHSTLHNLLAAYEENPMAFGDDWNIPESGNGLPDLLDEVKWELDWLLRMTNPDGSVHIKMGNRNYSENTASPPSSNTDPRYYGPTCSAASISVASIFAHAAMVYEMFPEWISYATELRQMAITTYNYSRTFVDNNSYETECDDGSIVSGDADLPPFVQQTNFVTASIYLFAQTQESVYQNYILSLAPSMEQIVSSFWGPYQMEANDALMLYTTLDGADANLSNAITNALATDIGNNSNGYFGFNDQDLYRASMPDWSYHWGSNQAKASYGNLNGLALRYEVQPGANDALRQYMDEVLHYFHGVNPQGMVYLSNMYNYGAERSVNEIYHTWFWDGTVYDNAQESAVGPPPGYLSGGPNQSYTVSNVSPPYGQPQQKAYLDFNTSWPQNSWEISEPAIYYQAAYLRLIANRVSFDNTTTTDDLAFLDPSIKIFPNPAKDQLQIVTQENLHEVQVFAPDGRLLMRVENPTNTIDISGLPDGMFILKINAKSAKRFVKG